MKTIYTDNNATTQVDPAVFEVMKPYFVDNYFNPGSLYKQGEAISEVVENSRSTIAKLLGVDGNEIFFTGSASEANNMAIKGVLESNPDRMHLITTAVEHPSVHSLCKDLERNGLEVTYLGVDDQGNIDIVELIDAIRPDTAIVSIMHANNETGVIFPINKLSQVVKKTDPMIAFHTDATQTVGKIDVNIARDFPYVDMLSFSGHKMYGPKGVGVLYKKPLVLTRPLIVGGHQEKGQRAGTENVPYIAAMAKALEIACAKFENVDPFSEAPLETRLRDRLERFVLNNIKGNKINGTRAERLGTTTSISFLGIEGEGLIYGLSESGICCSTGSACSSGNLEPSHVLKAMGIPFEYAHGTLRFSFGRFNTESDVEAIEKALPPIVANLRRLSPFWDNEKDEFRPDALKV
ncbi:MAG: aminotransferase class V-fold PLP-dependent enzyme [Bacteriovoracaceae bacterium]|nr:aminotransferase class V-fold PLP-dependent enzyme [Bacteriovoracaceae bacterium]